MFRLACRGEARVIPINPNTLFWCATLLCIAYGGEPDLIQAVCTYLISIANSYGA